MGEARPGLTQWSCQASLHRVRAISGTVIARPYLVTVVVRWAVSALLAARFRVASTRPNGVPVFPPGHALDLRFCGPI